MFCIQCGKPLPPTGGPCPHCGFVDPLAMPRPAMAPMVTPMAAPDPALQYVVPVNTSAICIVAGYLGLFSVLSFPAPFAILTGYLGLRDIKTNPGLGGKGRAIFALVMGILFSIPLVFFIVMVVMAAVAGRR